MNKKKMNKEELRELILQQAKEGKVVFKAFDGLMSMELNEIVKQPTEGLLYDLNRDKATVLSWIDDPKWVNDFAVSIVIEYLHTALDETQKALESTVMVLCETRKHRGKRPCLFCLNMCMPASWLDEFRKRESL